MIDQESISRKDGVCEEIDRVSKQATNNCLHSLWLHNEDEFEEVQYRAALFDPILVFEIVKSRIDEVKEGKSSGNDGYRDSDRGHDESDGEIRG